MHPYLSAGRPESDKSIFFCVVCKVVVHQQENPQQPDSSVPRKKNFWNKLLPIQVSCRKPRADMHQMRQLSHGGPHGPHDGPHGTKVDPDITSKETVLPVSLKGRRTWVWPARSGIPGMVVLERSFPYCTFFQLHQFCHLRLKVCNLGGKLQTKASFSEQWRITAVINQMALSWPSALLLRTEIEWKCPEPEQQIEHKSIRLLTEKSGSCFACSSTPQSWRTSLWRAREQVGSAHHTLVGLFAGGSLFTSITCWDLSLWH